jgi:hypothetical protein
MTVALDLRSAAPLAVNELEISEARLDHGRPFAQAWTVGKTGMTTAGRAKSTLIFVRLETEH